MSLAHFSPTHTVDTGNPLSFGASFYVHTAGAPGSPWWQTFTQY